MVPDLPYAGNGVPDDSEATNKSIGRFARQSPSSKGLLARLLRGRFVRRGVALVVAGAVGLSLAVPPATADDLTDKRDKVKQQIAQTTRDMNESGKELSAAAVALDQAQADLEVAQIELARTQGELRVAEKKDIAVAAKLKQARIDLKKAQVAVKKGQEALDAQEKVAGAQVRDQYQQQSNLMPIALLVNESSTVEMETKLQWSTTMFDTTKATIDKLTKLQRKLNAKRDAQTKLEAEIAEDRRIAAENLKTKQRLEKQAEAQTATVASLVKAKKTAEAAAQQQVEADKQRYQDLNRERAAVEKRIAERVARAKAEAARKAAAERAARLAAKKAAQARAEKEAAREAAQQRAAEKQAKAAAKKAKKKYVPPKKKAKKASKKFKAKKSSKKSSKKKSSSGYSGATQSHGFIYPVSAPITSPYGMRLHPTLGYWKLHDGTDFGAGCGSPMRAAYSGKVSERYFNAGYGNRLIIDHGNVDGSYISTAYNHAIRYTVSPGDHVDKGEVIGYVGTTGYSTGCHLHLMVYKNGNMINPMSWF